MGKIYDLIQTQKEIVKHKRVDKINYYLDIAEVVLTRGTCLRRNYGAVIVKDDRIVSTGYNGAPRGRANCCDLGYCYRKEHDIKPGTHYEKCRSSHAEANAIIQASAEELKGSSLFLVGHDVETGRRIDACCCMMCKRAIINAQIDTVYARQSDGSYKIINVFEWIDEDDSI